MQGEIGALKAKLGALAEAGLNSAEASSGPDIAALNTRMAKLEAALPDLATAVDRDCGQRQDRRGYDGLRQFAAGGRCRAALYG